MAKLNVSARSLKDSIVRLQIDDPLEGGGFKLQTMNLDGFTGTSGDGLLSVGGFTGFEDPDTGLVTLFVVNNRPSVDSESGELLDQLSIGANATVDVFRTTPNDQDLEFVRTYSDQHIATPNRVAALSATSFYVTNDHGKNKLGVVSRGATLRNGAKGQFYLMIPQQGHHLSPFIGTGDVTFCSEESGCAIAAEGLHFPNGLTLGRDGLIYVPSSMFGTIDVFKPAPNKRLQRVDQIKTGFAIDNVSADKNGVLFVAAFPRGLAVLEAYNDPWNYRAPSAGLRIQKSEDGSYTLDKAIEDGFGEVLPAATTVVHDVRTGRLFFSSKSSEVPSASMLPFSDISLGVISPWIGVCEPNAK